MKIESTSGCTSDSLTIDGVDSYDIKIEDLKEAIKKCIDSESDMGILRSVLIDLVENRGDYEDIGVCEEYGYIITKYTLEV